MGSLFDTDFSSNIARIQLRSRMDSKGSEKATSTKEGFPTILADVEDQRKKARNSNSLDQVKNGQNGGINDKQSFLSNLSEDELLERLPALPGLEPAVNTAVSRIDGESKIDTPTVKIPDFPGAGDGTAIAAVDRLQPAHPPIRVEQSGPAKAVAMAEAEARNGTPPTAPKITGAVWSNNPYAKAARQSAQNNNIDEIRGIIKTAGKTHGIDPHLSLAVAQAESSFNPEAISVDGHNSKGVFQLLDGTAADMMAMFDVGDDYSPFDAKQNSFLGTGYLRHLHELFSKETKLTESLQTSPANSSMDLEKLAVAAFNAGPGSVASAQRNAAEAGSDPTKYDAIEGYLPASTRAYVSKVTTLKDSLAALSSTGVIG